MSDSQLLHCLGQVDAYCDMVKAGCKPAANVQIPARLEKELALQVKNLGCEHLVEKDENSEWATLWIFNKKIIGMVILAQDTIMQAGMPAAVKQWIVGNLYGYSLEEIEQFCEQ
jgi:hypothetical protein